MFTGKPWKPVLMIPCILALASPAVAADAVTKVIVRPIAGQPAGRIPITFGQVFKRGDIKQGVQASVPGASIQADVKRKYDDGSVRFAVISMMLPVGREAITVPMNDGVTAQLAAPLPVQAAELLKTDFDATVTLKFPDGTKRSASARTLLKAAGTSAKTWLAGPVATEWLLSGSLVDARGQPDPDLRVQFHVRAYAGCKAVRVAVVVENCLDTWAGNIGYDAAVTLGKQGPVVYEKKDVNHRRLSRWRKDFWWPAAPPQVDVAHDLAYLSASGALPNYDRSLTVPEKTLAEMAARWAKSSETDILGSGSLTKYMPTTGGREEIGPYPNWTVQYLLSIVLRNADPQQHGRDDGRDVRAAGVQQAGLLGCPHGGRRADRRGRQPALDDHRPVGARLLDLEPPSSHRARLCRRGPAARLRASLAGRRLPAPPRVRSAAGSALPDGRGRDGARQADRFL